VAIEDDVWIGIGAIVLKGVRIGAAPGWPRAPW
jgi:acetyltransferase-like isoleucine patch superfamily enzyme